MRFTSEQRLDDGVLERDFTLGEIPGVLWTCRSAPAPLILSGHNGGLHRREARLVARARHSAAEYGYAVAAIDAPGHGDRPRSAADEQHRADLHRAIEAGEPVDEIVDAFILPLVEKAVRNGRPPWTPSLRCPRSAARSGTRG
jgi:pimeloyl-ACP methyl ester carboxylesterase